MHAGDFTELTDTSFFADFTGVDYFLGLYDKLKSVENPQLEIFGKACFVSHRVQ